MEPKLAEQVAIASARNDQTGHPAGALVETVPGSSPPNRTVQNRRTSPLPMLSPAGKGKQDDKSTTETSLAGRHRPVESIDGSIRLQLLENRSPLCLPANQGQPYRNYCSYHPSLHAMDAALQFRPHEHAFSLASSPLSSAMMHRPRTQLGCPRVVAAFILAFVVRLVLFAPVAEAALDTFIYAGCSPSKYQPGTPFESNLKSLLTSITDSAPNGEYNSFTPGFNGTAGDASAPAYGLYQCRGDLDGDDCASCVRSCLAELNQVCAGAYAASLQLEACYVRYDSSDFVGQLDTAMVYRKCSTSTSGDGGFLRNRDAVLASLQQGVVNGYKVSSAADVKGVAQCLGDLVVADCATCLGQAVGQLKGTCGTALAADVYLAQCYVRYWASGYHFRPTQDYSQDDVGKTIAIAIGICAGLAILVVFVSLLRKRC